MRTVKIVIFLLLLSCNVSAQTTVKEYYSNQSPLKVKKEKSDYYLVGKKIVVSRTIVSYKYMDSVFVDSVKSYSTKTDRIKARFFYQNGEREGAFIEYYSSGAIKEKGTYENGDKSGTAQRWHTNRTPQMLLNYVVVEKELQRKISEIKIIDYWDSLGNQLIKAGNGNCVCFIEQHLKEDGTVKNGVKDGEWRAFSGDTLVYEENYQLGVFQKGKSFKNGQTFEYTVIEDIAEISGGYPRLVKLLGQEIRYPKPAKRKGIQGTVYVKFIIDKDGSVINAEVLKGVETSLDAEALRVINGLEKWKPGRYRGQLVKSQFALPIKFKLNS